LWLVLSSFIITLGELYFSPIGLSLVTKVSPARAVGMMMGVWLLSSFFGNILSGYLGTFYDVMSKQGFFSLMMGIAVLTGAAFFAMKRPIQNAIGEDV
jgi:POT family proton-dependent oligopeptide transporter